MIVRIAQHHCETCTCIRTMDASVNIEFARDLFEAVTELHGFDMPSIIKDDRRGRVVLVRHLAAYIVREETRISFPAIGKLYARHHATVMNSCRRIQRRVDASPSFAAQVAQWRITALRRCLPVERHEPVSEMVA